MRLRKRSVQAAQLPFESTGAVGYRLDRAAGVAVRTVQLRAGGHVESVAPLPDAEGDAHSLFDLGWLRSTAPPPFPAERGECRMVDLFSGCGGLTFGVAEACRALGLRPVAVMAVDVSRAALDAYGRNMPGAALRCEGVEAVLDGGAEIGEVDVLMGGPPCQGHSDLNNHTRRDDPKNRLALLMARAAELWRPAHVIVENVPAALNDRGGVVDELGARLEGLGYRLARAVLNAADFGVAQRRRRLFIVASRLRRPNLGLLAESFHAPGRALGWAIGDLAGLEGEGVYDTGANHYEANRRRIDYLFDHGLHDLPDEQRPDCHRLKRHAYKAVYGRLRWEQPAPTLTGGFGSTGQGRFVHPSRRRTLTPHEAARVQFFPDCWRFDEPRRRTLQELIGNAVPPKLGYVIGLELLR
ncbi:MAG: DNA cytosine methyltransferase [Gemmataceae bacterium]|nr:DNA cytosine methyltransferase [Gemmataceae bacterium]